MSPATLISAAKGLAGALVGFVHDYQTLIAGALAIAAAYIAARPVWRQLDRMSVQTGTMFREFLADRVRALTARRKWLTERIDPYRTEVGQRIYEMRELENGLNIEWVFHRAQLTGDLKAKLQRYQREQRDPAAMAARLQDVVDRLSVLEATLNDIHRPHSGDQSGEDYALTDAEWAEIGRAGEAADERLDAEVAAFEASARQLEEAIGRELSELRDRLRGADEALLKASHH